MKRRHLIKDALKLGMIFTPLSKLPAAPSRVSNTGEKLALAGPKKPITIYNNWSAYDELSDNIPLTEELAMKELNEIVRLKKAESRLITMSWMPFGLRRVVDIEHGISSGGPTGLISG